MRPATITHPEKVLFPDDGITKGELAAYYEAIAPAMVPHIAGRPVTMECYPSGIDKKGFWQKDVSKGFPDWLERVEVPKKGGVVHHPLGASKLDCTPCPLKSRCCPKEPARKVPRSIFERSRDIARSLVATELYERSRRERKKIEMLFAHLKRIIGLRRLRLRGPTGAKDEFLLAATAQNLRKLAKLIVPVMPKRLAAA